MAADETVIRSPLVPRVASTEVCFSAEYFHAIRVVILRDKNILRVTSGDGIQ